MANSVPVTSLAAEAVYGANNITIGTAANPCLPYLQVSGYEVWASTTNDRTAAVKVGSPLVSFWQHTAATPGQAYWYWAKTVDASGAVSDFFPATTTSTVTATPKTSAGLILSLSAPAIVVPADASGAVTSFAGAVTTAKVLDGTTDVTASWAFSAASAGVTVTQSGSTFTLTAVAGDNGYFDVSATRAGFPTLTARCVVSESKTGATGAAGASAPALRLTASSQVFAITAAGSNSPASITFTASLLGGLTGTPTFSVTAGTATLTGSGLTRTLTFANLGSDTATIQASLSGSSDTITVAKIREGAAGTAGSPGAPGAAAVTALLSNEAHTLQADTAGTVGSFTGASTSITIFEGLTDSTASWTLSKADTGVTSTLSGSTVTITAAAADAGYVDITATRSGYANLVKRFTVTKSKQGVQGAAGASAPTLRLSATSQIFQVTAAGANSPASITFTAELLGGLSGTPSFSVSAGTATLTGTGLTRTLTFANLSSDTATITATLSGSSDSVTVAKLREGTPGEAGAPGAPGTPGTAGADAVVALLSNEAHVVQADSAGVVANYSGASTSITIYVGLTDATSLWTLSRVSTNCISTLTGSTVAVTELLADSGYVDITATRASWPTLTKRFVVTKSKAGASAPSLRLTASSQIFQVTAAGANSPASITFTAALLGGLTGTPSFAVSAGTATLAGTGNTRTLAYSGLTTDTATITATVGSSSDSITVAKVREGATGSTGTAGTNAITALLSNEAHTVAADAAGTVSSFAGASTTMSIYQGTTDSSASWTVTKVDGTGVTSTLATRTVTVTALTADSAFIDITAARSGFSSITKRFVISKSKQGITGNTGGTGSAGARGSMTFYVSGQNSWTDAAANTAANAAPGGRQLNDVVTQYNATNFSQTRFWNGSAWTLITQTIDGNLLVNGSVGATQISATYVYAGSISATQVTAGTFTGRTFQTASSGVRVVLDAVNNELVAYNANNAVNARIGGAQSGIVYAVNEGRATLPAVYGWSVSAQPGVYGVGSSSGHAILATVSVGSGHGLFAHVTSPIGSHAIRGFNDYANAGSGLVGVNNMGGSFAFYSERGGYGPFTGQHDALIAMSANVEEGDIVCDVSVVAKPSVSDAITIIERSTAANLPTCVGVFVSRRSMAEAADPPAGLAEWAVVKDEAGHGSSKKSRAKKHDALAPLYDLAVINSLGEGLVNVCGEAGDIAPGDLIVTSSRPGKGMKQADDIIRSRTVAKAREGATFSSANQVKSVACIYLCG